MPCIWGQHNNSQLFLAVVIFPVNAPGIVSGPQGAPYIGQSVGFQALIDTGATTTGITSKLAGIIGLQPIGKVPIHGVGGVQHHNSYLFYVGFPFAFPPGTPSQPGLPPPALGQIQGNVFILQKVIQGCEFHSGPANFDVILGMDVLSTGSLIVQGNQTFTFSF
jgi:hypothetical protein